MFIAALIVLFIVARRLLLVHKPPTKLSQAFSLGSVSNGPDYVSTPSPGSANQARRSRRGGYYAGFWQYSRLPAAGSALALYLRAEVPPDRVSLSEVPLDLGGRIGLDLLYLRNRCTCLILNLNIIFRTIAIMLRDRSTY